MSSRPGLRFLEDPTRIAERFCVAAPRPWDRMQSDDPESDEIRRRVRVLGEAGGRLAADRRQIEQLRQFFGRRVLRSSVDPYLIAKYHAHVEIDRHWPDDTTPDEYLESLRTTVLDGRSQVYLTDAGPDGEWTIYVVGRVRRAWRGPGGSNRVVVLFNAERHVLITGFQPSREVTYVDRQGGFWLWEP
jgi:hypothetical protein